MWTMRSRPGGGELEDQAMRVRRSLMQRRRRTRVQEEYARCESLMSRLDDVEFDPLAMPYELSMGLVAAQEVKSVVRFAGLEAATEWTHRDTDPLPAQVSNPGMGIHASMDFLGAGQSTGVDLPACRNLIRWVPGISEHTEETAARQKQSANSSFDPRVLFEAS